MAQLLAQTSTRSAGEVVVWVIILAGIVGLGGIIILWLRTRLLKPDDADSSPASLLEQLRRARDRGQITPDEFRLARDRLIEGVSGRPRARMKPLRGEVHDDGTIRARPGFDLLGDPLPDPAHPIRTDQPPHAPE